MIRYRLHPDYRLYQVAFECGLCLERIYTLSNEYLLHVCDGFKNGHKPSDYIIEEITLKPDFSGSGPTITAKLKTNSLRFIQEEK